MPKPASSLLSPGPLTAAVVPPPAGGRAAGNGGGVGRWSGMRPHADSEADIRAPGPPERGKSRRRVRPEWPGEYGQKAGLAFFNSKRTLLLERLLGNVSSGAGARVRPGWLGEYGFEFFSAPRAVLK